MRRTALLATMLAAIALPACSNSTTAPTATTPATSMPGVDNPLGPTATVPAGLSCADIGGVFEPHGTDGRGSCVPADQRAHCHVPPAAQDNHYVPDFTLTPPFPQGTVAPAVVQVMLEGASNADCWKPPAK
ncbi:hypothetical protein [Nocardia sp. NPDC004604]|uniref:hypothetical protein n=1 Tax=Nocardia sp. NPDC004604 TaxID=3157013 RepID=UPI0033A761A6